MRKPKLLDPKRHSTERLRRSRKQEHDLAAKLSGGSRVPGSGNQWHSKGDVKSDSLLVECKTTEKASYRLSLDTLKTAELEAIMAGKLGVLQIEIQGRRYAVLNWDEFERLIQ